MTAFETLGDASYISIESFRKNGEGVKTPVTVIRAGNSCLLCWTGDATGKVKRIRSNQRVNLAKCDARGNIQSEWVAATARVEDRRGDLQIPYKHMAKRHRVLFPLYHLLNRLFWRRPVMIEFTPANCPVGAAPAADGSCRHAPNAPPCGQAHAAMPRHGCMQRGGLETVQP